ncbi:Leucine-rich repeat receptor-like protein kinase PXC1 [Linum grandiflorum]
MATQEKETTDLKTLAILSPQKTPSPMLQVKHEEMRSEFVFFVEEKERFDLGELLESAADLQNQTICSSLYKVVLKDSGIYAVKRLKKLAVSFDDFGRTMTVVGNLKHPNILPLIAFSSNNDEKLLIYKYQTNRSLSNLQQGSIDGKRDFPWKLRLSIASGIAKGLGCIYHWNPNPIPHGNLKPSNIMLNDNEEALISEYGYAKYRNPKISKMFSSNGYTAPEEETVSEKGDVYSFGIILLELLTGKTVEKSGIDLPKWVRSMVREEWTGEVFDRQITNPAREYAFHLLNIALKCVSSKPEDRPTIAELVDKFDEVSNANEDVSISSMASTDHQFSPKSCCLLHSVIPEAWDTPGSNY